jgi:predicted acetyltransferase
LSEFGHREPDQVEQWFQDHRCRLLTILNDMDPVGFALVATGPVAGRLPADYRMSEFFISRAKRRRGIGLSAVRLIFDRFNGSWEVTEYQRNPAAVQFWRRVIGLYTGGRYEERMRNGEVHQYFRSRSQRPVGSVEPDTGQA